MYGVSTWLIVLLMSQISCQVSITIEPNVTVVGEETTLECEQRNTEDYMYINWYHRSTDSTAFLEFLAANKLNEVRKHFTSHITIVNSGAGHSILKIRIVNKHHAGTLKCCDDEMCKYLKDPLSCLSSVSTQSIDKCNCE